jgi:hypothetical protein
MVFPAQEIGRTDMSPVHVAVPRSVRVVLKKHVVSTVDKADAVGVVHPSPSWTDVQSREVRVGHGP